MKLLIQNVNVISPGSAHHLTVKDILITGEKISAIEKPGTISTEDAKIFSSPGVSISTGWFDLHVNFCEPGNENKEDLISGSMAAMQGGFTGVLIMPSTNPPVSGKPAVEYILHKQTNLPVHLFVAGSLSENREGKDLSEMFDMHSAGTIVFTDDKRPVKDAGLMSRALLYVQNFGGKIFSFAEDSFLSGNGLVHEGTVSTGLGLRGIPSVAEELMISRDLSLAEYTNASIHFSTVSSAKSVELIRKAKARGIKVTADVSAAHLMLDESCLESFDTLYKVRPPFRSAADREALIAGLADGTIDCICSDHTPQDTENKKKEFELAAYGAAGIETAFAVARTATVNKISVPELISKFTTHPRNCAGVKSAMIEVGQPADLTLFNADTAWTVSDEHLKSKSGNNPFLGKKLLGKPVAIINRGIFYTCS
jgi:dihydroorotase